MAVRTKSAACLLGALLTFAAHPASAEEPVHVVLRTYNNFGVRTDEVHTAEQTVRVLLMTAGIDAAWRSCRIAARPSEPSPDPCDDPLGANEMIVRIVASVDGGSAHYALGFSYVDVTRTAGILATVFADRVGAVAHALETDAGVILGRAVAHEIGHLLLGTHSHSPSGLMRAVWTRDTLAGNREDDWQFSEQEARDIRAAAEARHPVREKD